ALVGCVLRLDLGVGRIAFVLRAVLGVRGRIVLVSHRSQSEEHSIDDRIALPKPTRRVSKGGLRQRDPLGLLAGELLSLRIERFGGIDRRIRIPGRGASVGPVASQADAREPLGALAKAPLRAREHAKLGDRRDQRLVVTLLTAFLTALLAALLSTRRARR